MRIIETEAYTFDELSDDAKENAKIELASEYFWENEATNSLYAFTEEIGIKITDYSMDWCAYGCINIEWEWIDKIHTNDITVEQFTGYCMDFPLIEEWNDTKDVAKAIGAWVNDCQKDYEYQQTDEFMIEHCEANEYEFTKEGKLI